MNSVFLHPGVCFRIRSQDINRIIMLAAMIPQYISLSPLWARKLGSPIENQKYPLLIPV